MVHTVLVALHVTAGAAGLAAGPVAMLVPKGRLHARLGLAYQGCVAVLTATALGLVLFDPARLAALGVIAVLTEAAALGGWLLARRRPAGRQAWHVRLMAGSYVSFVTAFLVVQWPHPVSWVLPTLVGSPLIAWASARAARRGIASLGDPAATVAR
jgi:uncharacterized membrane protein HdeD (DUF308 family)